MTIRKLFVFAAAISSLVTQAQAGFRALQQDVLSVCEEKVFSTDRNQYFTIQDPEGRGYLSHEQEDSTRAEEIDMDFHFTDSPTRMEAQWRFIQVTSIQGGPQFFLKNRKSGVSVVSSVGQAIAGGRNPVVDGTCNESGTRVTLSIDNEPISVFLNNVDVFETKCTPISPRTCSNFLDDAAVRTLGSRRSNCFFTRRRLKCARSERDLVDDWIVEEVTDFPRLAGPEGAPKKIDKDDANSILQIAERLADLENGPDCIICVGVSALGAALGMNNLGESAANTAILDSFADLILSDVMVSLQTLLNADQKSSLHNQLTETRRFFLGEYSTAKRALQQDDVNGLAVLADQVTALVATNVASLQVLFLPGKSAVPVAFLGFDLLVYTIMESLAMMNEVYLLQSLAQPTSSCSALWSNALGVETLRSLLQQTQDLILEHRVETACCERNHKRLRDHRARRFFNTVIVDDGQVVIKDTGLSLNEAQDAVKSIRDEREVDVLHLSYPIDKFNNYMDGLEAQSVAACEAIRADPDSRVAFLTNVPLQEMD